MYESQEWVTKFAEEKLGRHDLSQACKIRL